MRSAMNDPQTGDGAERECQSARPEEAEDQRPEPKGDEDPAPEEVGYGYGV